MPSVTSQVRLRPRPLFSSTSTTRMLCSAVGEIRGIDLLQHRLAAVAEGGVAEIVPQGDGLGQVLVEAQGPGDGAGHLGHLQGMGQARAVVVPQGCQEHLGLVLEPPEGVAVDDPVAVELKGGAHLARILRDRPSLGLGAGTGEG